MSLNIRNVGLVSFFTIISRILGFVRDIMFTSYFGTSQVFEAFISAFQIPNLFRMIFGEGALHGALIPVFTETKIQQGEKESHRLASSLVFVLGLIFMILIIAVEYFTPAAVALFLPGFLKDPLKKDVTVLFLKIMFPYLLFIGLAALFMAFLNTYGKYSVSSFSPSLLNIVLIIYMFFFLNKVSDPLLRWTLLAFTVVTGGAAQLFIQYFWFRKNGFTLYPCIWHPAMNRVLKLFLPTALIFGITQINLLVSRAFASFLPEGSISYLYFANRILQLPLGIFSIAIVTVSLPSFSEASAEKALEKVARRIRGSLLLVMFLILPASMFLCLIPAEIIQFVFERGQFTHSSTLNTASALMYYGAGLISFSLIRLLQSVFYAFKNTRLPFKIALVSMSTNLILNAVLIFPMKHNGLALANTLADSLQCLLLFYFIGKYFPLKTLISPLYPEIRRLFPVFLLFVITLISAKILLPPLANYLRLFIITILSGTVYTAASYFTGLLGKIRSRMREC